MLSSAGNKHSKKKSVGLISEKKTTLDMPAHFFCTFLCCCFNLHDYNVKLPETS